MRRINPPPMAAWDFDLGGCPECELPHCCFWEYAKERKSVRRLVWSWRKFGPARLDGLEGVTKATINSWFCDPYRPLADVPEFPRKHWLELSKERRRALMSVIPGYPDFPSETTVPEYDGPTREQLDALGRQRLMWNGIRRRKQELLEYFTAAHNDTARRRLPVQCVEYLNKGEHEAWEGRLAKLSGRELQIATIELRKTCEKLIEQRLRPVREHFAIEIDWTKRPTEIVAEFVQLIGAVRVHEPRSRSGGHATNSVELLKAIGAKRLSEFFRKHQASLPKKYATMKLHAGLATYTQDERKLSARPEKPLYSNASGWDEATKKAAEILESLWSQLTVE